VLSSKSSSSEHRWRPAALEQWLHGPMPRVVDRLKIASMTVAISRRGVSKPRMRRVDNLDETHVTRQTACMDSLSACRSPTASKSSAHKRHGHDLHAERLHRECYVDFDNSINLGMIGRCCPENYPKALTSIIIILLPTRQCVILTLI